MFDGHGGSYDIVQQLFSAQDMPIFAKQVLLWDKLLHEIQLVCIHTSCSRKFRIMFTAHANCSRYNIELPYEHQLTYCSYVYA